MGLYDRDYMRDDEPGYRRRFRSAPWSPTIALLVVLGLVFLVQKMFELRNEHSFERGFALSLDGIQHFKLWQLLTFQFLHGGILHIALNGITLYSFGRFMEQTIGRGRFLTLYFLSGIAGGLLQVAASWTMNQPAEGAVVGASAGISGLLGAFILARPDQRLVLFPIPIPIRAQTLLWIILPLSIFGTVYPFGGIAHAAHLGGLLAGGAFMRWFGASRRAGIGSSYASSDETFELRRPPLIITNATIASTPAKDDFIEREVNPILEKIAARGIQSLTDRERKVLAEAQKKIGQK